MSIYIVKWCITFGVYIYSVQTLPCHRVLLFVVEQLLYTVRHTCMYVFETWYRHQMLQNEAYESNNCTANGHVTPLMTGCLM